MRHPDGVPVAVFRRRRASYNPLNALPVVANLLMTLPLYMQIDSPLPPALIASSLFLPGLAWLGWYGVRSISERASERFVFAIGFSLAVWLLAVHVTALAIRRFDAGLALGTILPGVAGYVARMRFRADGARGPLVERSHVVTAGALTLLILPAVLRWDFHDMIANYGTHFSFANQIANNVYPPRDLVFPEEPLRYHYAIDTLFAMVMGITRLPVDLAIDLVTLVLWFFLALAHGLLAAWLFGEEESSHLWSRPVAIGMLAAGWPFLGGTEAFSFGDTMASIRYVDDAILNPPLPSYFFQPAWMLGFPFGILILLALQKLHGDPVNRAASWMLFLAFGVLGVANAALFVTMLPAVAAVELVAAIRGRRERIRIAAICAVAAALSVPVSGFSSFLVGDSQIAWGPFATIGGTWQAALRWDAAVFGLLLPAGLFGLWRNRRMAPLFALLLAGCFAAFHLFRHKLSWDIVKFATVAQWVLAIQCGGLVVWLERGRRFRAANLLAFAVIGFGVAYFLPFWYGSTGQYFESRKKANWTAAIEAGIRRDDVEAISWLRKRLAPGEIVLADPKNLFYAYFGGFPQFWVDKVEFAFGYDMKRIEHRAAVQKAQATGEIDPRIYAAEGVRWVVVSRDRPAALQRQVERWIRSGRARPLKTFGAVVVLRIE